ncbi:tryptophan 2,3-dioxygenase [Actinoalloteichus caeruleus]|uniref:Tryptophan 2,3-dioxygenase n=1 Tax=Actinoalloteichus caeruleus DSM 43889 TaxID=1120930 RepID=A0ABT1JMA4_ACTCY|nr:tryptophan 2,3-dioxygenase family protein [Actinoalloteichus caeruleus]MCP2333253.1 tryptophan 2,3-dioxygenase [Actinoalloteichus caeruleus DSM 43889]
MPVDDESEPRLDFGGATPYEDYVRASVLTSLQQPRSGDPAEMAFLVTTQVMELWFRLLTHEWDHARRALRDDDVVTGVTSLRRSLPTLAALVASWQPIAWLTPTQFNSYRSALGEGSGFQSAQYRHLEFVLGDRSTNFLTPHRADPVAHASLERELATPSLYDEALRLLHRRGHRLPASVLDREPSLRHEHTEAVERAWADIYRAEGTADEERDLLSLGEVLTDVAEGVWRWRQDHLMATRRAMGDKTGTGGSSGVAWLTKRAARPVFPELWSARGRV